MKEAHRDDRSVRWIENVVRDIRYGLAALAPRSGVHARGGRRAGARHRRQHGDVQPGRRRALQAAALPRARAHRARVGGADGDDHQLHHHAQLRRAASGRAGRSRRCRPSRHRPQRWRSTASRCGSPAATCRPITSRCSACSRSSAAPSGRRRTSPAPTRVVMLSHAAWQRHFGGDPRHPRPRPAARRRAAPGHRRAAGRRVRPAARHGRSRSRPASGG